MTRRLPWIAVGAGAAIVAHGVVLLGVTVVAVATDDGRTTYVDPPAAVRRDSAPPWAVGTCLDDGRAVSCARAHEAEVVALPDPGDLPTEGARRWTANAVCARTVFALTAGLTPAAVTYASSYPSTAVAGRDARVSCFLVGADRIPLVGSLTAGDLHPPSPPLPLE
ncbi:hypothetical protein [Kineococcus rhizosphaerae]|uniref:Uncharacterized protein n=1 Tax=Kineococcus rhizosphaerae TaxID=559628 RepID=A0A2T0R853_9ACTN|nr:hypothetical protein [Kineococcus rhizosphaerae]PRY17320.1 hypothetical protein CLV37_102279 [Kineococcus rhizosphaerae]